MDIDRVPTYQEICDLIQGITGSYESITCAVDADFANQITGKTHNRFEKPEHMAVDIYNQIADIYFWAHILDCSGCQSHRRKYNEFWGQYYLYSKMGCTRKTIESDWPEGSEEFSRHFIENRKQYKSIFPRICELYASGVAYEDARETAKKEVVEKPVDAQE